jgi:S1-C subfamily serine protease
VRAHIGLYDAMETYMKTTETLAADLTDLVKAAAPSIVSISGDRIMASGFIWRSGLIVTADEALYGDGPFHITLSGGENKDAKLRGRDSTTNVAVLEFDEKSGTPAPLTVDVPQVGTVVLAQGAIDSESTAALGIVSRSGPAWQSMRGGDINARLELDVRLRRQSEGGLVFNMQGMAFGMAVFGPRRRTLVIPVATLQDVAQKLLEHGRIARGYLGLGLQPVEITGEGKPGIMVMSVDGKGPAFAAGLLQGDVITGWNGVKAGEGQRLSRLLTPASVGTKLTLDVKRAGALHKLEMTIGERPPA